MPLQAGERLGPYEVVSAIGSGGMGEVYRARDTRLDRTVAIKVSKADFSERFEREARAIAALNHPNICALYDVGPNYLVMELADGTPIKGPLPVEKAVEYASQILDALDAAHTKGITHRDLKPSNILITKQGIKLLDFGLAKQACPLHAADTTLTAAITGEGQIVGTLQYASPEQLQGRDTDARADIFSFGCVLYEMLSGKRAFDGESAASVIAAVLEREPAPLDLSPPLDRVIRKCLVKDPEDRFQSARDIKYSLTLVLESIPAKPTESNRWIWPAAAAALAALGILVGWGVLPSRAPVSAGEAIRLQLNPPPGTAFDPLNIAISPDGKALAFTLTGEGRAGLWVRPLNGDTSRLLTGSANAASPIWSPDSSSIAYAASSRLWRIDLAGGAPMPICDLQGAIIGGFWTPDGRIIFAPASRGLWQVPASGGPATEITRLDAAAGETAHYWPVALPGGKLLYMVRSNNGTQIVMASLAAPADRKAILTHFGQVLYSEGHLLWRRDGTIVAQPFDPNTGVLSGTPQPIANPVGTAGATGQVHAGFSGGVGYFQDSTTVGRLAWFDRTGKRLSTLGGDPEEYLMPVFSPEGRRVAVYRGHGEQRSLWLLDLERDSWTRFSTQAVNPVVWSPGGTMILFFGLGWGRQSSAVFRKEVNTISAEQRLSYSTDCTFVTDWSRDSRNVMCVAFGPRTQKTDLLTVPVTANGDLAPGEQARRFLQTPANETSGRFVPEPNPRWVIYESDESGKREVYLSTFPQIRATYQISSGGGTRAEWSPRGDEIYYRSAAGKLISVRVKLGAESVQASPPEELFPVHPSYAVAPDGRRFLAFVPDSTTSQPLEIILNWPALLKKGVFTE